MKFTYIKSSTVIVEAAGIKVLCDPWLTDGIYYGSWYHYPPLTFTAEDFFDVDYIYISHIHPDHMDSYTLNLFPKEIPLLIHDYQEKFLRDILKRLGFRNIVEIAHKSRYQLGDDFSIEILAADNCDPALCGKFFGCPMSRPYNKTLQIDSLALFHGEGKRLVNTNDCQYELAKGVCDYIVDSYGAVDFAMVGYSSATAYPQCFESLTTERKIAEKRRIRDQFLHKAAHYVRHLAAPHFLPFAGQYLLGGKLAPLNRFRSPPHHEELLSLLPPIVEEVGAKSEMILLNSGASFDLETKKASRPFVADNPIEREIYIDEVLSKKRFLYEEMEWEEINLEERLKVAHDKMRRYQEEYGYHSDWSVYIDTGREPLYRVPFDGSELSTAKRGEERPPFVRITLDYSLLRMILDRKAHWNNAEIGSHLTFFRDPERYEVGVFRFLSFLW